jgi:TPP-dependent pyruvate/acetoin dehydrogenase alpha subunit
MSTEAAHRAEALDAAEFERLYESMVRIRQLEDAVHLLFLRNEIEGTQRRRTTRRGT